MNHILIKQTVKFAKKFQYECTKDKHISEFKIIVIIQASTEFLHIAYIIYNIVCLKKFLQFFAMDQTMINILS